MYIYIYIHTERDRFDPWVGKIPWTRKWQPTPTPVFLPGKFHGQRSLAHVVPKSQTKLSNYTAIYMCVYMYICMYIHMYMYVCIHIHMYMCMYAHTCILRHMCIYVCIHTRVFLDLQGCIDLLTVVSLFFSGICSPNGSFLPPCMR